MIYMQADKGLRLLNFAIDSLLVLGIYYLFAVFLVQFYPETFQDIRKANIFFYFIYFLYYTVFESISGKTLGKLITKTKVVDANYRKPGILRIATRSAMRFFPLDFLTYLFGFSGFHDKVSNTKVVLDKLI